MTVSSTESRITYSGNGSTTTFAVPFTFDSSTDLEVNIITNSTRDVVLQTLNTDYTVSGTDIVMTSAPSAGQTLVITLGLTFEQSTDYIANDPFPAETHENALDELAKQLKELKEDIDYRCFKLPVNTLSSTTVTDTEIGASKVLRINASADGIELATVNSITNGGDSWSDAVNSNILPDTDSNYNIGALANEFASVYADNVYGTIQTAAQPNITSLGTLANVTIDNVTINGNDVSTSTGDLTFTPSGVCDFSANTDHMVIPVGTTAQRDTSDGAGSLRWNTTDGRLEAYTGSAWVQYTSAGGPGAWSDPVDASITVDTDSTYDFGTSGARLANLYADNLYGTLAEGTQGNITSVGTLTSLTVDNLTLNGNTISTSSGNIESAEILDLSSGTAHLLPPTGTTAQRTGTTAGQMRYNSTDNVLEYYNGSAWVQLSSSSSGGGMTLIATQTASADSTIDFANNLDSTYEVYVVVFSGTIPATDGARFQLRIGTGGTPTYQSGASDYSWSTDYTVPGAASGGAVASDAEIELIGTALTVGNATGEHVAGRVFIHSPSDTNLHTYVEAQIVGKNTASGLFIANTAGSYNATTAVTSLRFLFSSGNITSGEFKLYGLQKST